MKKRRGVVVQFKGGRSAISIARTQKINRQMVYKLVAKFKKEGARAYVAKKAGRPRRLLNALLV